MTAPGVMSHLRISNVGLGDGTLEISTPATAFPTRSIAIKVRIVFMIPLSHTHWRKESRSYTYTR